MSSTQQIFRPIQIIFRLSPLMAALTVLMSPFTATQADELSINIKDVHQLSAPIQLPSYRFHQDHVLGTSLDVVVTTSQQQDAEKALQAIQTEISFGENQIKIDRSSVVESITNTSQKKKNIIISGEGGCGKTAIFKEFYCSYLKKIPI